MPTILADYRERQSQTFKALSIRNDTIVQVTTLETGDYLINNELLIERKAGKDFAYSVLDQRIFRQARRLYRSPHQPLLLLEDHHQCVGRTLSRQAWLGAIVTLNLVWGIPILYTATPAESAWLLARISAQRARISFARRRRPAPPRTIQEQARQEWFLTGLPFIGPKRARRLLTRFHSIQAITQATEQQLSEVPGIGPKAAKAIHTFFR